MELTKTHSDIAEYGEKYRFYHNADNGTIVCTTIYKGETVRGIAKCSPEDNFNIEAGKKLAYLRCKRKFLRKKLKRAQKVYTDAAREYAKAQNMYGVATEFVEDVEIQLDALNNELSKFERELN